SFAIAESGATGRRTRRIGLGFSPCSPCGSAAKTAPAIRPAPRSHTNVRPYICLLSVLGLRVHHTGVRIEEDLPFGALVEVEHVHDRTGRSIEGAAAEPLTLQPVVLDELGHRSLRDQRMADKVLLGEGRDHHEGDAETGAATSRHLLAAEADRLGC